MVLGWMVWTRFGESKTDHIAGNVGLEILEEGFVRLADGGVAGVGRHVQETVEVVHGDALTSHCRLQRVVCHSIGRHLLRACDRGRECK